jgi:hypothetical protein
MFGLYLALVASARLVVEFYRGESSPCPGCLTEAQWRSGDDHRNTHLFKFKHRIFAGSSFDFS